MPSVYLAGPISALTYDSSEEWRDQFIAMVEPKITCFSPLRNKQFLRGVGVIDKSYEMSPLATSRGIMTRDHFDCSHADVVVCNFLNAPKVSIGTIIEVGFAYAYRKPLITIMEKGNIHEHPMVDEATGYRVDTVEEAAMIALAILLPK